MSILSEQVGKSLGWEGWLAPACVTPNSTHLCNSLECAGLSALWPVREFSQPSCLMPARKKAAPSRRRPKRRPAGALQGVEISPSYDRNRELL